MLFIKLIELVRQQKGPWKTGILFKQTLLYTIYCCCWADIDSGWPVQAGKAIFYCLQNWYYKSQCYWVSARLCHWSCSRGPARILSRLLKYKPFVWWYNLDIILSPFQDRLMSYQDSGFSEEDPDHHVTTCLMKTPSGSIYIQPTSEWDCTIFSPGLDTKHMLFLLWLVQFLWAWISHLIEWYKYSLYWHQAALSSEWGKKCITQLRVIFDSSRMEWLGSVHLGAGESSIDRTQISSRRNYSKLVFNTKRKLTCRELDWKKNGM